jgi:hypothetical protein
LGDPVPNHEFLPPIMQKLVEVRGKLAEAVKLPNSYETNLEVQKLNKRIADIMLFPEVKLHILKG